MNLINQLKYKLLVFYRINKILLLKMPKFKYEDKVEVYVNNVKEKSEFIVIEPVISICNDLNHIEYDYHLVDITNEIPIYVLGKNIRKV